MSLLEGTGLDYACYTKKTIDKSSAIPMWILHQLQRCHQLKDLFLQSSAFEHFEFNHSRKWILDHTCRIVSKRFISDSLHSRDPRKVINHTLATWCTATEARLRHDQWWAMRQAQGNEAAKIVIFSSNLIYNPYNFILMSRLCQPCFYLRPLILLILFLSSPKTSPPTCREVCCCQTKQG